MERHGLTGSLTYITWLCMRNRCNRPSEQNYYKYGGKGIKICEEWNKSFIAFYTDMGLRPGKEYTIDRIDATKGYYKDNCKWSTYTEQNRHRSSNVLDENKVTEIIKLYNEGFTVKSIAEMYNVNVSNIYFAVKKITWRKEK